MILRYAPDFLASVKSLIRVGRSQKPANTRHGIRGSETSKITEPICHRSPISAALTSIPVVVKFSPKEPLLRARPI